MSQKSSFDDADPAAFRATIDVNLFGVINGITTLLPLVKETASSSSSSGGGGGSEPTAAIVITGSKQGITNPPGNPAYNASKAAVKAVAEHLSFDLARDSPRIGVHLLVPGWVWTGLTGAAGAGAQKSEGSWWPEQVVDFLQGKMDEGQFWVLCPDNEVSEATDRKRMLWSSGDVVGGRKPLSRWRDEYKGEVADFMAKEH